MVGEGHAVQIPEKTTERAADALPAEPEPTSDDTNAGGRFNDFTPVFPAFCGGRTARSLRRDHFPPPARFASFHQQPRKAAGFHAWKKSRRTFFRPAKTALLQVPRPGRVRHDIPAT
jgi:hypothetical protein